MVCLLTSSVCHTLGCCAQHISLMVWRFDYVGIAVLIVASFYPPVSSGGFDGRVFQLETGLLRIVTSRNGSELRWMAACRLQLLYHGFCMLL